MSHSLHVLSRSRFRRCPVCEHNLSAPASYQSSVRQYVQALKTAAGDEAIGEVESTAERQARTGGGGSRAPESLTYRQQLLMELANIHRKGFSGYKAFFQQAASTIWLATRLGSSICFLRFRPAVRIFAFRGQRLPVHSKKGAPAPGKSAPTMAEVEATRCTHHS